jgi:hypothetical protein
VECGGRPVSISTPPFTRAQSQNSSTVDVFEHSFYPSSASAARRENIHAGQTQGWLCDQSRHPLGKGQLKRNIHWGKHNSRETPPGEARLQRDNAGRKRTSSMNGHQLGKEKGHTTGEERLSASCCCTSISRLSPIELFELRC